MSTRRAPRGNARPWLCPEPRCTPLLNLRDGDYADITKPEPGQTFVCWGMMEQPVEFTYDGVEHPNDLNDCHYTPLKGLIRYQENAADWNVLASYYSMAGDLLHEAQKGSEANDE